MDSKNERKSGAFEKAREFTIWCRANVPFGISDTAKYLLDVKSHISDMVREGMTPGEGPSRRLW